MKSVILLFFLSLFYLSSFGQSKDKSFGQEPGKCYAKCLIPDTYQEVEESFPIYTGNYSVEVLLDSVYFRIEASTGSWIYIGHQDDFERANLDKNVPVEKIVYLHETEGISDIVYEDIFYLKLQKAGGMTEWREIVCGDKIRGKFILNLEKALAEKGFLTTTQKPSTITPELKAALVAFQKANQLPEGQLDVETMEALGL